MIMIEPECHQHGSKNEHRTSLEMRNIDFSIAFQPIVDCLESKIFGYEALVRGGDEQNADSIIKTISANHRYSFDQQCRDRAIQQAVRLGMQDKFLSINFLPNAINRPETCIRSTIEAAQRFGFPIKNIIFEFTEVEKIRNIETIKQVINSYKSLGFKTAIDDFGAGYAGLGLLADFQSNIVKIDMALIRNIDHDIVRQTILTHSLSMLKQLNIDVIAEGIESQQEMRWLRTAGVRYMQGFYFARPLTNALPEVNRKVFELH
jgi:EAL domain-containing protein (putative c-di-GMP-specific phosphodiesterase class I)